MAATVCRAVSHHQLQLALKHFHHSLHARLSKGAPKPHRKGRPIPTALAPRHEGFHDGRRHRRTPESGSRLP
jgi:hypothetical protein